MMVRSSIRHSILDTRHLGCPWSVVIIDGPIFHLTLDTRHSISLDARYSSLAHSPIPHSSPRSPYKLYSPQPCAIKLVLLSFIHRQRAPFTFALDRQERGIDSAGDQFAPHELRAPAT